MTPREEGYYLKEIFGTLLWIALLIWLFRLDGIESCRRWLDGMAPTPSPLEESDNPHPGQSESGAPVHENPATTRRPPPGFDTTH